jgi:hypothetical protein
MLVIVDNKVKSVFKKYTLGSCMPGKLKVDALMEKYDRFRPWSDEDQRERLCQAYHWKVTS